MLNHLYVPITEEQKSFIYNIDPSTGKLSIYKEQTFTSQPWQVCVDPNYKYLYQTIRNKNWGGIITFKINQQNGDIDKIGEIELKTTAVYITTDQTGKFIFCSYMIPGMVTVHRIKDNGTIDSKAIDTHTTEIYAHYISTDPLNRFAFVPHVHPTDTIFRFLFNQETGKLESYNYRRINTYNGYGPRHLAFHPFLNILYSNDESSSTITAYAINEKTGNLTLIQRLPTISIENFADENTTGTIRIHPKGKSIYVTNRGHDSISIFSINPLTGLLKFVDNQPTGEIPRTLAIDTQGKFLFSGSDETGQIFTYRIEKSCKLLPLDIYDVGDLPAWILPITSK